ncbi:MAG TPA: hypothetical protein VL652_34670 [Kutzneria sp.]|jgi:hypothetical protein|nr:hypothetical protein [Kutzneria sp.]
MAALTMSVPTAGGTAVTVNNASASDTITQAQLGTQGCILLVRTAGTINTITISDGGATPAGNPASVSGVATVATGVKAFQISPSQVNLGTGLVTITSTPTTALTYEVYPA